jgi:hypothetical protein
VEGTEKGKGRMKGLAGYGRYDDNPDYVGCPRARTNMTPCIARDGSVALADDPVDCVGCGARAADLLTELGEVYPPVLAFTSWQNSWKTAEFLRTMVRQATEPGGRK